MARLEWLGIMGIAGGTIATFLGGWDAALQTLLVFMAVDYITGLVVAGVFKKSPKSESGALESRAGWKGLWRKGGTLLIVLVASMLDRSIGSDFVRDSAVVAFTVNETLSIIENAGLMGVPVPAAITKAIDLLKRKEGAENGAKGN